MPALWPTRADDAKHLYTFLSSGLGSASEAHGPARLGPGGAFFVEWRSIFVLHFTCKLLRFHCDELRCFVPKSLISK
jgi:hypothetical protein